MAIDDLRKRLLGYLESGNEWNEEDTRSYFINPVLRELGHDPEDPAKVRHNDTKSGAGGIPDYTILDDKGEPVLFVEAKRTNENLEQYARTNEFKTKINYAFNTGKRWVAITNGRDWWLCDSKKPTSSTDFSDKIVFKTSLEEPDFVSNIEYLSRQALREGRLEKFNVQQEIKNSFERLLSKPDAYDDLIKLLQDYGELNPNIWREVKEMLRECRVEIGSTTKKIEIRADGEKPPVLTTPEKETSTAAGEWPKGNDLSTLKGKRPPQYVLMDGKSSGEIRHWNDLLVYTAEWLAEKGKINQPVKLPGSKLFIINDRKEQPSSKNKKIKGKFKPINNAEGFYVWPYLSGAGCIRQALALLEYFGYKPGRDFLKPPADWKP